MAFLAETNVWEPGIYQLETTDPVEGGAAGKDNVGPKQLANRTVYLKALVDALGTGKQPLDATLTALAALATVADKLIYATGADTFSTTTLTAFARTLLDDADAATARATLGAAPLASPAFTGTPTTTTPMAADNSTALATTAFVKAAVAALVNASPGTLDTLNELAVALGNDPNFATTITTALAGKQPLDATLTAIAALATAADKLIYATGADTFALTPLTAFMRSLLDDADAAAARATLEVSTGFVISLVPNGYIKFPNWLGGLIIQWGAISGGQADGSTVTFPIAFPTACRVVNVSADRAVAVTLTYGTRGITASGFTVSLAGSGTNSLIWIAIGN